MPARAVGYTLTSSRPQQRTPPELHCHLASPLVLGFLLPHLMSIELKILALSIVLGLVQILLSAHSASLQVGYRYTATAREARPQLTGVAGRLERALRNFLETFPLFAAAVLLVQITGRNG